MRPSLATTGFNPHDEIVVLSDATIEILYEIFCSDEVFEYLWERVAKENKKAPQSFTKSDNAWLNLYSYWSKDRDLFLRAVIDTDDGVYDTIINDLTQEEKAFFTNLMEQYAEETEHESLESILATDEPDGILLDDIGYVFDEKVEFENEANIFLILPKSALKTMLGKEYPKAIGAELRIVYDKHLPYADSATVSISPTEKTEDGTSDTDWTDITLPEDVVQLIIDEGYNRTIDFTALINQMIHATGTAAKALENLPNKE